MAYWLIVLPSFFERERSFAASDAGAPRSWMSVRPPRFILEVCMLRACNGNPLRGCRRFHGNPVHALLLAATARAVADGEARVAVRDTGPGIAAEDQARIFEEFQQTKVGAQTEESTGLGLTLAKRFIELHGGRLWVESEVGRGSTFTFALPIRPTNVSV